MTIPKQICLLLSALISSTLGWIALGLGDAGISSDYRSAQMLGTLLLFIGSGYQLLALALALRGFDRFDYLRGNLLLAAVSAASFCAVPLFGIILELGDRPMLLTAAAFLLAALPWLSTDREVDAYVEVEHPRSHSVPEGGETAVSLNRPAE